MDLLNIFGLFFVDLFYDVPTVIVVISILSLYSTVDEG